MHKVSQKRTLQCAAGAALLLIAGLAQAQYAWIDEKGLRQFSDKAPPTSVPLKNILRSPVRIALPEEAAAPAVAGAVPAPQKASPTLADREADYRKRQLEKAELDKKNEAQAANDRQRKTACDAARQNQQALSSGARIRSADGAVMDDKRRAEAQAKFNSYLSECSKG